MPAQPRATEEDFGSLAAVGYLMAVLLPFVGGIIGIVLMTKRPSSGVAVLLLSVVSFFVWLGVLSS